MEKFRRPWYHLYWRMRLCLHTGSVATKAGILAVAALCALNTSLAQAPKTKYKITGYTSQKTGKAKLLLYTNNSQFVPYDSTDISNGTFAFSGVLNEPKSFQLMIGSKGRILFVGNETIVVDDRNEATGAITVKGSKLSDDYDSYFNHWLAPLLSRLQAISRKLASLNATRKKEIDSLTLVQNTLFDGVPDSAAVFIRQHPSSFVSLYLLNSYKDAFNAETTTRLFSHLDTSLKMYPSAQSVLYNIQAKAHTLLTCPSFSLTDERGDVITPRLFAGNYLLIDFWASTSASFAKHLAYVQQAADQFGLQNFKILTLSLDKDTGTWKTALANSRLMGGCKHVFLPGQFNNPVALQFGVNSVPRLILIDPDGNIIENNLTDEKLIPRLKAIFTIRVNGSDDVAMTPCHRGVWYRY